MFDFIAPNTGNDVDHAGSKDMAHRDQDTDTGMCEDSMHDKAKFVNT